MFTKEQLQAINEEGKNILVSAGAGAGKTAVLTARVLRKLNEGTHINELLILTFTKAAAAEMKDRIRRELLKNKMYEELNLLDSAYITTFDSYSLSLVKKYHTKLNITNNIKITDAATISILKKRLLDEIFDENYLSPKKSFMTLIDNFSLKNDEELKNYILELYNKVELKYDKEKYLSNYLEEFDKNINNYIDAFNKLLIDKQNIIKKLVNELPNYFEDDFVIKVEEDIKKVVNASNYDEFIDAFSNKISTTLPKNSDPEGKKIKTVIYDTIKEMKNLCIYDSSKELKNNLLSTRNNLEEIINILIKFNKRFEKEKNDKDIYSYTDIARLSIKLVKDYENIREEVKSSFKEILLDEYQDTSDIQELFIQTIANNNVYMVGDIKQSIYRFRNANPNLFKEKYETYNGTSGIKIDLSKNFRSREEVISDINLIFNQVMDSTYGGASYQESHQLSFGNINYNKEKTNFDNHLEIITYDPNIKNVSKEEEEAFIIANDIINKINSNYKVLDKKTNTLRKVKYSDFVILLDRKKHFSLYKKIFEYLSIPLSIIEEENIREGEDLEVIRNLLRLLICIKEKRFDEEFKYTFTSISRSYLYKISDDLIYKYFINDSFIESDLYKKCLELIPNMDNMNLSKYLLYVLDSFNYEEKILTKTNIKSLRVREEYIYNLCRDYETSGHTIYEFINYLNELYENDYDLTFNINKDSNNSCKIMTIHKSKGLEFPICYYGGLYAKFNSGELTSRIFYDSKYGIIIPEVNGYYKNTILKELVKDNLTKENISERIRLFYVALTRAKEKMIMVIPEIEEDIITYDKNKYNSYLSIIKSIYTILTPYIKKTNIIGNKDYLKIKNISSVSKKELKLEVNEITINSSEIAEKHYSKEDIHLIESSEKHLLEYGTKVHEILEEIDFNDYNLDLYDIDDIAKEKINSFINSDLMKDKLSSKMYKEYEFLYEEDNSLSHGIIDLLIETDTEMIIIDYKLKNIDDSNYDKQLNGYKNFITDKTDKDIKCFLYSILDEKYREVI